MSWNHNVCNVPMKGLARLSPRIVIPVLVVQRGMATVYGGVDNRNWAWPRKFPLALMLEMIAILPACSGAEA